MQVLAHLHTHSVFMPRLNESIEIASPACEVCRVKRLNWTGESDDSIAQYRGDDDLLCTTTCQAILRNTSYTVIFMLSIQHTARMPHSSGGQGGF